MRRAVFANASSMLLGMILATPTHVALAQSEGSPSPRVVSTEGAPKANGPYAQGVVAGGFLFTAGQVARDPATSKLVEGDIAVQTNRVLDNLEAILKAGGCRLADVVKATVFLTDLGDFDKMNEAYAKRFGETRPARSTVQVAKLPG
ncbi:MAG: Rid family detoxifying hydrolase, partial [Acidobacteriota bacterium]|nr:Rid family detoxifying hydrolase [Acidobacteriota bacterium]